MQPLKIIILAMVYLEAVSVAGNRRPSKMVRSPSGIVSPKENLSKLPCPNAEDIAPCICTSDENHQMTMDCSGISDEDDLNRVFNQDFSFNNFFMLVIKNTRNLKAVREDDLGSSTFKNVDISQNILISLKSATLTNSYETLENLYLSDNDFSTALDISPFKRLESFIIAGNGLTNFPTLRSDTLLSLGLGRNLIEAIPADAFQYLPSLQSFTIDGCAITQLHPGTFTGLHNLQLLDLSNNKLKTLSNGTIILHSQESELKIQNNEITTLAKDAFTGITTWLDASNNALKVLDEDIFRPVLEADAFLSIRNNPFNCGCNIAWLILNRTLFDRVSDNPTCEDGTSFKNLNITVYENLCQ